MSEEKKMRALLEDLRDYLVALDEGREEYDYGVAELVPRIDKVLNVKGSEPRTTPRPWTVRPGELDGEYEIAEVANHISPLYSEGRYTEFEEVDHANARLIEKAVNTYDKLIEYLHFVNASIMNARWSRGMKDATEYDSAEETERRIHKRTQELISKLHED